MTDTPTPPALLRGALYARQSKNRQASIEDQIEEGRERFADEGWPEPMVFQDGTGASRFSTGKRDDWPRVVELMEAGQLDLLWLWEQSRGGRVAWEFLRVLQTCADLGVKLYIEEHERLFDLSNNDGDWELLADQSIRDEAETNKIARRTNRAKRKARARGNLRRVYGHQPPIGYRETQAGTDDAGKPVLVWEPDPEHRAMLREIGAKMLPPFQERLHDAYAAYAAAHGPLYLNRAGGRRGAEITPDRAGVRLLHHALRRPVTAGLITDPPEKDPNGRWKKRGEIIRQVIPDEEAPMPRAMWEDLQRQFAAAPRGREPARDKYPHAKLLACGRVLPDGSTCGNQLSGAQMYPGDRSVPRANGGRPYQRGQQGIPAYACKGKHKITGTDPAEYRHPCYGVTIPAEEVNDALRFAVQRWWTEHADEFAPAVREGSELTAPERERLLARRDHLENQRRVFAWKWHEDEFDEDFYQQLDASVKAALTKVRRDLDALDAQDREAEDEAAAAREGRLPSEIENWADLSPDEQNRWIRKAFVTPIAIVPAKGRHLTADQRMTLVPRPAR